MIDENSLHDIQFDRVKLDNIDIGDMSEYINNVSWCNGELEIELDAYYNVSTTELVFEVRESHVWLIDQDGETVGEIPDFEVSTAIMDSIYERARDAWYKQQ